MPEYQQYPGTDPLHDFSNFIDNVGLTLDFEGFEFPFCAEEPAIPNDQYFGSSSCTSGTNTRSAGDPMSLSDRQEDVSGLARDGHASLRTDRIELSGMNPEVLHQPFLAYRVVEIIRAPIQSENPWTISEEKRRNLKCSLVPFKHVLHNFELPSHHTLSRYYRSFVDQFLRHYPLLHVAALRIDRCPPEMALAIAAIGAQYRFEAKNGLSLYQASKAVAFEQMKKHEQTTYGSCQPKPSYLPSPSTLINDRNSASLASAETSDSGFATQSLRIDMIRTLIMLIAFASWDWKAELLRDAFSFQSTLARCVREDGLQEPPPSNDEDWHSWIHTEGTRRTKLIAFAYLNVQTLAYNLPPIILNNEIELQLPCSTAEWEAHDTCAWENARKDRPRPDVYFQDAIQVLLDKSQHLDAQRALSHLSPLANFILLQALIQRICLIRQLSFPAGAALREADLEEMEYVPQMASSTLLRFPQISNNS